MHHCTACIACVCVVKQQFIHFLYKVHVYICVYSTCIYIHVHVHVYSRLNTKWQYVFQNTNMYVPVCIYMYMCTCICKRYAFSYILLCHLHTLYMYIYVYIHVNINSIMAQTMKWLQTCSIIHTCTCRYMYLHVYNCHMLAVTSTPCSWQRIVLFLALLQVRLHNTPALQVTVVTSFDASRDTRWRKRSSKWSW